MKLCPQCEFIYEDDQSVCDMDGKELVSDAGTLAFEDTIPAMRTQLNERAAAPVIRKPDPTPIRPPASQTTGWQSRAFAFAAVAGVVLAALLFVVYYALTHRPRSGNANQASSQTSVQSPDSSASPATDAQVPEPDLVAVPGSLADSPEQSLSTPSDLTPSSSSFSRTGLASSPVSAGLGGDSRAPATIWLTNGASIKADEVWEGKEGIWYRQAGMVTLLKRSRVKAIQPLAQSRSTAVIAEEKNRKPQSVIAQNRPRVSRPEPTDSRRESKVSSFLKKTGRILKKPFQF